MYIERDAAITLEILSKGFPVVAITGPRQSGKTTLARHTFDHLDYVSLETPTNRQFAIEDPLGFLGQYEKGVIIDEAQNCPDLFSFIQEIVDSNKKMAQFVLTGSQQFGLLSGITQSLAGRVGMIELLPFSLNELNVSTLSLDEVLMRGFYPPVVDRDLSSSIWLEDYVKTYLERDVRQLVNVKDLNLFQRFLKLCAGRAGQLLNIAELCNAADVTVKTGKSWLSVLETSYIIFRLQPHHKNFSKKLVKTPKLYFYDSGLLAYLLNIKRPEDLALSPFRGQIFESMIVSELHKQTKNFRGQQSFYFWRDNKGVEIDILVEAGLKLVPIEVKSGQTVNKDFFKNINLYQKYAGDESGTPILIYGGDKAQKRSSANVISWRQSADILGAGDS